MKKILSSLVALSLLGTVFAGEFPDISINDLKSAIESKKVVVIDVNGTDAYKKGHIPSAINFEANSGKLSSVLPQDKNALIVAYCGGPRCNAYQQAAKEAQKLGYKNVKHLSAGITGWMQAGEKTAQAN